MNKNGTFSNAISCSLSLLLEYFSLSISYHLLLLSPPFVTTLLIIIIVLITWGAAHFSCCDCLTSGMVCLIYLTCSIIKKIIIIIIICHLQDRFANTNTYQVFLSAAKAIAMLDTCCRSPEFETVRGWKSRIVFLLSFLLSFLPNTLFRHNSVIQ